MDFNYKKIFDLQISRAKKLYNSSYLEECTGLIGKVASTIDGTSNYYFDNKYYLEETKREPNNSFDIFIKSFTDSFSYSSSDKIHIIRGRAGVGKTLFFKKGVQILTRDKRTEKYIPFCIDFRNIDSKQSIEFYENYLYDKMNVTAIDCIRKLNLEEFKEFEKEYSEYCGNEKSTPAAKLFPVGYFCKRICSKYGKPCIIVLDNIDLACVDTQKKVFKATVNVCNTFHDYMEWNNQTKDYLVYFAMRPETFLRSNEAKLGEPINFPLPNIQAIALAKIKDILFLTAKEYDENTPMNNYQITYYDVLKKEMIEAKKYIDIAEYFYNVLKEFLTGLWNSQEKIDRLGKSENFHCDIVNYNIRTFLSFLSDTLYNGGFKPLTKEFNESLVSKYYNIYDYVEMLIKGRWEIHPGNKYMDSEGGNKAPIVFNVFDTSIWNNTQIDKIKHFMLYIRILQYFRLYGKDSSILFENIEKGLCNFFNKDHILHAIQEMIFIGMLYSFSEGDENIAIKQNYKEVYIEKNTSIYLSPMGEFYIEKFICEFEYLYQMSLSSLMPEHFVNELKTKGIYKTEKELTVLRFLTGIFYIIKDNIEDYIDDNRLSDFIEVFCKDDNEICRPFRRMLKSFIDVMNNKIQHGSRMDTGIESKRIIKLKEILSEALILQTDASNFFQSRLNF